jgi:hypothetical protein
VAQDAPFGFIGIQNNLNPLLESFQRLKAETGGTGSALKALGQSLIGPAGLGVALSVVSAGILFYQQYQQRANKTTNDAKKVSEDYISTLTQLNQVRVGGAAAAQSELTTLDLLFKQYKNTTNSLDSRKEAYQELQKLYPAFFANLKFENEISGKTTEAYGRLTSSILASAKARAASDLITKNSTRQLENEQKILDLTTQLSIDKAKADKARAINLASIGAAGQEGTGSIVATNNEIKALKQLEATQIQINNLKTDSNILTQKNLQLEKSALDERSKIDPQFNEKIEKSKQKAQKQEFARGKEISIERLNSLDTFLEKYRTTEAKINKTPLIGFPKDINTRLAAPLENLMANIIPQLRSSFQGFFDDILMRGKLSFDSLGKAILNTFASVLANQATTGLLALLGDKQSQKKGNIFSSFGKLLGIGGGVAKLAGAGGTAGTAALATGTAATGGALLPILAGVAAVAGIASLFKKKQQAPLPAQSSSISTSAAGSAQDFGGGRVVFEISGTNLVGVLNRAGAQLKRYGP